MKLHNLKHTCIIPVLCAALLIPSYTVHADWEYNAEENTLRYKTKDGTYLTSVFRKIKGYTYYFNADGTVHTGWLDLKGDRYFFSESGAMLTSQWIGDKYLMKNGKMARSRWVDNHNVYVNKNGSRVAVGKKYKAKFIKTAQGTKYRNVDLFLVDDIQFIAGKQQTQNEFFHTFNNIYEAGHQIVITSDRPPLEMSLLDDRLRTRFEGGLMADIQPPDLETRMAITRNKAAQLGLILSDDAVEYIASNITANIRQLEGVIKRLTAYKEILDDIITIDSVKRAIKDVIRIGISIPTPERIIRETSRYYSLKEEDLRGQNRSKNTAIARQVSMYLMRSLTNLSLKDIGAEYEDRNHATVLSSIRKVEDLLKTDPDMAGTVRDITSNINTV